MYGHGPHGQVFLKKAGKAFKDRAMSAVAESVMSSAWGRTSEQIYALGGWAVLWIELRLPGLRNKSWTRGAISYTPGGSPRSPYKRLDGSNYIKLLEDAVAQGTGIDDSLSLSTQVSKDFDWLGDPEVEIVYQVWLPAT